MPLRVLSSMLLLSLAPGIAAASIYSAARLERGFLNHNNLPSLSGTFHDSAFVAIAHTNRSSCEETQGPEALTTPNPLTLDLAGLRARITVSFVVGIDGRIHSPLILESAGPVEDRTVLQTVRSWRYRPATCNGVPTEVEAKVEFSAR